MKNYLSEKINLINKQLDILLPGEDLKPQTLHRAMRHSVFAGGKRLRPILFLATLEVFMEDGEKFLPFACALELIHTYSLIHDDLPAMDDDDFRRGLPTCHKKFGEGQAILAGDALLTHAFSLMLKSREERAAGENILRAIDEVALGAGLKGMIVGQVVDLESEHQEVTLEELKYIHRHKTGALIRASVRSAALLAGSDDQTLAKLTGYAENLGLAFQITDDILDIIGDESKLGKPVGSDKVRKKATYPSLLGVASSKKLAEETINQGLGFLDGFPEKVWPLRELGRLMLNRES